MYEAHVHVRGACALRALGRNNTWSAMGALRSGWPTSPVRRRSGGCGHLINPCLAENVPCPPPNGEVVRRDMNVKATF